MTLELTLILGFLFHLMGDYIFQNDWMANEKTKHFLPAFIHATIYSLPFLMVVNWRFWLIIYITHFFIDRYRLAVYWIRLVNIKDYGRNYNDYYVSSWRFNDNKNFGYGKDKPVFISLWLMIIIDNSWHLVINSASIILSYYLGYN